MKACWGIPVYLGVNVLTEINEEQYRRIEDCLPVRRGHVSLSNPEVLIAILFVAEQACKWRGFPLGLIFVSFGLTSCPVLLLSVGELSGATLEATGTREARNIGLVRDALFHSGGADENTRAFARLGGSYVQAMKVSC